MRPKLALAALIAAATMAAAPAAQAKSTELSVLSSRADQVSGGDALIRVDAPPGLLDKLGVQRNGSDVTGAFEREGDHLVGLVEGFDVGANQVTVTANRHSPAPPIERLRLTNYPNEGPMFSGPHQEFFVCNTIQAGLGEPIVDNQDGEGFRVQNPDGSTAGWSLNCSANDFRQVYASVIDQWLSGDHVPLLGGSYTPIPLFV